MREPCRGWRDVTRDAAHEPKAAQFRIDLRATVAWLGGRTPHILQTPMENGLVRGIALTFRVWELLVLTIVLQIGVLPRMARDFHRITLSAPLVNLAAVPLTGVVVPLGFLTLGSAVLLPGVRRILAVPLVWVTLLLTSVVHWFAGLSRWSYRIPGPHTCLVLLFFAIAVLSAVAMRLTAGWSRKIRLSATASLLACSLLIALFPFSPAWSPGQLEVTVLDVGQGGSLFIVSPRGKTLLIDGGGSFGGFSRQDRLLGIGAVEIDPGEEAVSGYLWSRGYQKLDVVALSRAHRDHLGGLAAILQNFRVPFVDRPRSGLAGVSDAGTFGASAENLRRTPSPRGKVRMGCS